MKDLIIKGLGTKAVPEKYLIKVLSNKAADAINMFFDSSVRKGESYPVGYSYFAELDSLVKIANLDCTIEMPDVDYD